MDARATLGRTTHLKVNRVYREGLFSLDHCLEVAPGSFRCPVKRLLLGFSINVYAFQSGTVGVKPAAIFRFHDDSKQQFQPAHCLRLDSVLHSSHPIFVVC